MQRVLILDDVEARHQILADRHPDYERVHVYGYRDALVAIETGRFDLVLLDHDLGEGSMEAGGEWTGVDVARALADLPAPKRPAEAIIHSHNPVGAEQMRSLLADAGIACRLVPFSGLRTAKP